jgi:crotonobetainyl-CoA:carnitine CoA-transferase CaiB-like acyl-CoA transferase
MHSPAKPLRGIRVLELARTLAAPWMGQILADLGADVVKVERPGSGDETRQWGPPFIADDSGKTVFSAYFQACNRGKRSVEVDFSTEAGRLLISRLAGGADIVIENFKVGTLARHGLDGATLCKANPLLIWCSITGFGQTGPYAARPGYDFIIQAMSGLMTLNGLDLDQPRRVPLPTSDLFTGVYGTVAVLAALNQRHATGRGTIVDLSLLDTQISTLSQYFGGQEVQVEPGQPGRYAPMVPQIVVPTADGSAALVLGNDLHFRRLAESIGLAEIVDDARFRDNASRRANLDCLVGLISSATRAFGTLNFVERMERIGVPAGPVNTIAAVAADPHLREREMVISMPGPTGGPGEVPTVRMPVLFNGVAPLPERGAPRLGEHNADIERGLDWLQDGQG